MSKSLKKELQQFSKEQLIEQISDLAKKYQQENDLYGRYYPD